MGAAICCINQTSVIDRVAAMAPGVGRDIVEARMSGDQAMHVPSTRWTIQLVLHRLRRESSLDAVS
jgi:hypothetical protein